MTYIHIMGPTYKYVVPVGTKKKKKERQKYITFA